MHSRTLAGALVVFCLLTTRPATAAADDATLFRVFLKDGTSLVSYGEFARVGDRVIFSMPTAAGPNPPLHLVNLPDDRVEWDKTNRYAASARATHYIETQAESDYVRLSNDIAQTLDAVSLTADPARRLAIVERARKALAEWPASHYNYRSAELRQMLVLLDEAIADLRASAGGERFALDFSAFAELPAIREPLLTPPTPQQAIEQTLAAARLSDTSAERTSLLAAAVDSLDRSAGSVPQDWASATLAATKAQISAELALDKTYETLTKRMVGQARQRARAADVKGLQRLLERIQQRDAALGRRRPDTVLALVHEVEAQLDAARQLRLERDRWALREPELRSYRLAISTPVDQFARLKPALEDIKALSGSTPLALVTIRIIVSQIVKRVATIEPPDELKAAHALFVSAAQLADNAALIRREATLAGNLARAWDASSAAAGALMLAAKARLDMQAQLRMPQLR